MKEAKNPNKHSRIKPGAGNTWNLTGSDQNAVFWWLCEGCALTNTNWSDIKFHVLFLYVFLGLPAPILILSCCLHIFTYSIDFYTPVCLCFFWKTIWFQNLFIAKHNEIILKHFYNGWAWMTNQKCLLCHIPLTMGDKMYWMVLSIF